MQAQRIRAIVSVIAIVAAILFLIFPVSKTSEFKGIGKLLSNIKLGLDIKGGSMLEYNMKLEEDMKPEEIIDNVILVLRKRLDAAGYTEAVVTKVISGNKIRVRVEIPGITDVAKAEKLIGSRGKLYFAQVIDVTESDTKPVVRGKYARANEERPGTYEYVRDLNNPKMWYLLKTYFTFGRQPFQLTGADVTDARADINRQSPGYIVRLKFSTAGAKKFETLTGNLVGERLAIVLDEAVIIAPVVKSRITGGAAVIEGITDLQEARNVAALIKSGNLPVDLVKFQERTLGPTLGKDIVETIIKAGLIGGVLVMIYMIFFYGWMGVVADIGIIYNLLLLLGILAATKSILTLPGIAGVILIFGTTVDGSIIIFERIKEELRLGRPVLTSIRFGYEKAFWTLFDANLTTILAGIVLYYFTTGTVRGFAVTLIIGVLGGMFTNLVVGRVILESIHHLIKAKRYTKELGKEVK